MGLASQHLRRSYAVILGGTLILNACSDVISPQPGRAAATTIRPPGGPRANRPIPVLNVSRGGKPLASFALGGILDSAARHALASEIQQAVERSRHAGTPRFQLTLASAEEATAALRSGRLSVVNAAPGSFTSDSRRLYTYTPEEIARYCPECNPNEPGYDPAYDPTPIYAEVAAMQAQVDEYSADLEAQGCYSVGVAAPGSAGAPPLSASGPSKGSNPSFDDGDPTDPCGSKKFAYYWAVAGFAGSALFTIGSAAYGNIGFAWTGVRMSFAALGAVNYTRLELAECLAEHKGPRGEQLK